MKRIAYIFFFIIGINYGQNKQILYDFAGLPQTLMLNPGAEVDNKFYFGFPLFSQVSAQGGFTGFSAYDIFSDNGVDINAKISEALNRFGNTEFSQVYEQLEVFSGGFKLNETTYLSGGYYQELDALVKIPKDLVDLVYNGNTDLFRNYSAKGISARAELIGVFHVGISKKINEKWQVGIRGKLYSSLLNASSKSNTGNFYTTNGSDNIYEQSLTNVDLLLQTSGIILRDNEEITPSYVAKGLLLGGNLGLGFDVGFTHHFQKQWTVSGSLQDIGFVYNTKDIESYQIKGDFGTEGFDLIFDEDTIPSDYWNNLQEEFNEAIVMETIYSSYLTFRPLKLNAAVNYSFGKRLDRCRFDMMPGYYVNKVGGQLFSSIGAVHSYISATLFYERWFSKYFQAKFTYTADPYSFTNIGLGISTQLGPVNLYFLADNLLYLNNIYAAKSASAQVGINFIFYNK